MEPKNAEIYRFNIFDMAKVWPHADYLLRPVGKITLNNNPQKYFAEIEQAAFSPSTMVPDIGPSGDPMLQARMFSYPDAARYRLGVNYQQLSTNHALSPLSSTFQRDGFATITPNYGPDPNHVRSSLRPMTYGPAEVAHDEWVGKVTAWTSEIGEVGFVQPRPLWEKRTEEEQDIVLGTILGSLKDAIPAVQKETVRMFARVDEKLVGRIERKLESA